MKHRAFNLEIAEQAADWAVRMDKGPLTRAEHQALASWLRISPLHVDEYLLATATLGGIRHVDAGKQIDIDELLKDVSGEVVQMASKAPEAAAKVRSWHRLAAAVALIFATLTTVGAGLWWSQPGEISQPSGDWYETGLGEQRSIQLPDGSVLHINTQSRLKVDYGVSERRIDLIAGEAMFEVEPNPERPFRVWAGDTVAEALGTTFNIRIQEEAAIVSVVEGTVKVDKLTEVAVRSPDGAADAIPASDMHAAGPNTEVILSIGEVASVPSSNEAVNLDQDTIEAITSWRDRILVFESDRLDVIAAEFNRYNRTQLIVGDTDLASVKFTGVFNADDPDSFVEFLEFAGGIEAVQIGQDIRLDQMVMD